MMLTELIHKINYFNRFYASCDYKDLLTCYLSFLDIYTGPKDFDPGACSAPA